MEKTNHALNTFRILYIIQGVLMLLVSSVLLIVSLLGGVIKSILDESYIDYDLPVNPGDLVFYIGIFAFIMVCSFAILNLVAAKSLRQRKRYVFIIVVAVLNCLTGMLGILLCIFTIIELNKAEVKALFVEADAPSSI